MIGTTDAARRAYVWMAVAAFLEAMTFGVGFDWDRYWHLTHVFETFWTPPHLFIYFMNLAGLYAASRLLVPELRARFGPVLRLPLLGTASAPNLLVVGGFACSTVAGGLDGIWHSLFGLDETLLSFPHSMFSAGAILVTIGLIACRLAIVDAIPLASWSPAFFGVVLGTFPVWLGAASLYKHTVEWLISFGDLPTFSNDAPFHHVIRILVTWDVVRANPTFIPVSAIMVGICLGVIAGFIPRLGFVVAALLITLCLAAGDWRQAATTMSIASVPANWLPIPVVIPAVLVAAARYHHVGWILAGVAYGLACALIWGATPIGVALGGPMLLLGGVLGRELHRAIVHGSTGLASLVWYIGIGGPLVTGVIDLWLRKITP